MVNKMNWLKKRNAHQTTDTSNLVLKTDYNTKPNEIVKKYTDHAKYITAQEFNKLTGYNFAARLKQANLVSNDNISDIVKNTYFDDKLKNLNKRVISNKTQHVLIQNELKKLQKFHLSLLIGQIYFGNDAS